MDQFALLRLFLAIADGGSLSAAARVTGQATSTVSEGLRRLEDRLGVRLFLRSTRHLSLTPEGMRFLADSRRILNDLDEAMGSLSENGPLKGEIRLTSLIDFGRTRLEPLLSEFMHLHPGVGISLTLSDGVIDLIEDGFDLGIRTGPLSDSRLSVQLLLRGRRLVCAAPSYWEAHGEPAHPRDLSAHNCLILMRPGAPQTQWQFREGRRAFSVRVSGTHNSNDGSVLRKWAIDGAGVVLKSEFDVAEDLRCGRLQSVLSEFTREETNLYAVSPLGKRSSRRVTALLDFLRGHLRRTEG